MIIEAGMFFFSRVLPAVALAGMAAASALAQTYPTKPVHMVVAFAPAGPPDIVGRIVSQRLSEELGVQVVVENRGGAGGTIGTEFVARAAPDGYTLAFGSVSAFMISPVIYANVTYDPVQSFTPLSLVGTSGFALVVDPRLSVRTLKEFIELARSQPGKLNYGSATQGTPPHLLAEMFNTLAGVQIFGIFYKGSADSLTALLKGEVQMMVNQYSALMPMINAGKARALVVTGAKRAPQLPEVPSALEAGLPGFVVDSWFGILGPKGMPGDVVKRLNSAIVRAIASKELTEALNRQGLESLSSTPEEFLALLKSNAPRWAAAVRAAGVKVQ